MAETRTKPHFSIVERPVMAVDHAREVYHNPDSANLAWFFQLNEITEDTVLKPGTMLVVPTGQACTAAEVQLAANLRDPRFWPRGIRGPIEHPEITNRLYELLEYTQTLQTPGGLGAYAYAGQRQIEDITKILNELQKLYQDTYSASGKLSGAAFQHRRRELLNRLDGSLRGWLRRGLVGPDEPLIRRRLGLSSKRIVHRWRQAGSAAGGIPELRQRIAGLNRAAGQAKALGHIGIALDTAWSAAEIKRHIEENRRDRNRRIAGEAGRLGGSLLGGAAGGYGAYGLCNLAFGVATGGSSLLWCAVVGGIGSFGGGYVGSKGVPILGESIYDVTERVADW
ncbi:uncharacterized protein sS8_1922 [Methylocaldum marinum]|uniref:Uncharacterized protein n=1 Tax=Methylocaldum marinum TaxID=1432792 RepID=A0A250KQS1_9GAMM|nr:hypothetical protein [Methylocaldum marinum]BBA33876.1 uncharacterized protein sS8_1922 [Methylocaldum marinum]